ncbi:MAG: hypothetical protein WBI60_03645 [Defluviitoga tunisiensis]|jgi:hypothetical protein|nr:hypothetical protein [Defluviitoga tunisiensis]
MKKIIIVSIMVMVISIMTMSDSLRSFDSYLNPSLLEATGKRDFFELEISPNIFIYQNLYRGIEIFSLFNSEKLTLDLEEINKALNEDDLLFDTINDLEGHFIVHIFNFGLGFVTNGNLKSNIIVPNELIKLIAEGNKIDEQYKGTILFDLDSSIKAGIYGSYNFDGYTLGIVYNLFLPIVYTKKSDVEYLLKTSKEEAMTNFEIDVNLDLYSSFNNGDIKKIDFNTLANDLFSDASGRSFDVGITLGNPKNPYMGFSLKNINIKKAKVLYKIPYQETIKFEDETLESTITNENTIVELSSPEEYSYPIGLSAFFRIPVLVIDIIPYGELYLESKLINWGIKLKTSLLEFMPLSLGIEKNFGYWKASLGFGLNTRIIENSTEVSLVNKEIQNLFDINSITFKTHFALGF